MPDPTPGPAGDLRPVVLQSAPIDLFVELNRWLEGLFEALHQLDQQAAAGGADAVPVPARLRELGEALQSLIERPRGILAEQVLPASADGVHTTDLQVDLYLEAATRIGRMMLILDELDEWSASGQLPHPARSPELIALLRWMGREIIGQLEIRRPPRPFRRAGES